MLRMNQTLLRMKLGAALGTALLFTSERALALPTSYTIVEQPGLHTTYGSFPNGLNNASASQAFGRSETGNGEHGVIWQNGTATDIGTLGGTYSEIRDGNDAGKFVGNSYNSSGTLHPFSYENGVMTDLLTSSQSGQFGTANAVDGSGKVYGKTDIPNVGLRPVRYTGGGSYVDLSGSGMATGASITACNAAGVLVGFSSNQAFLYIGSTQTTLPRLGGTQSQANDVNALCQVVGSSLTTGNMVQHAFLFTPTVPGTASGTITDLGTLGGDNSYALGCNSWGVVVGQSEVSPNNATRGFVWTECSGMVNINSKIDPNAGWVITSVLKVNEKGELICYGSKNGVNNKVCKLIPN